MNGKPGTWPPLAWVALGGALALMALLAWTPGISFQEDLGRHLLLGRIILEKHAVPRTNLLTYTHPDFPFVNHHWLSEVLFYLWHRAVGLNGLIVIKIILMATALALAFGAVPPDDRRPGQWVSWRWALYWLAGLLAAVILGFRAHIRPELFSFLNIALYLWLFERLRKRADVESSWNRIWPRAALVGLMLFWVNAHIYFLFGLGMAAAFAIERGLLTRRLRGWAREGAWLAALVAAACINPNGPRGLLYPLHIFSNYGLPVTENASPLEYWKSVINPMLLALPVFSAFVLLALPAATWRSREHAAQRRANRWIALAALLGAWAMARNTPLLALAGLPVIGEALRRKPDPEAALMSPGGRMAWARAVLGLAAAVPVLVLNLGLAHGVVNGWYSRLFPAPIAPTPFGFDDESRYTRLRQLHDAGNLPGPVFTDYNIGSLVEYQIYPEPGYVDNRPEAFPESFWRAEYLPALALGADWDRIAAARGFNSIIVSPAGVKEPFIQELARRGDEWRLTYLDDLCAVFVRPALAGGPSLDEKAFEQEIARALATLSNLPWWRRPVEAEALVYRLYGLLCIGERARAWPHLRELHRRYPDYQIVHELMRVTAPPEEWALIEDLLARRARWPLAAKQALDWGRALLAQGRAREAEAVFRRGLRFFPLSPALHDAVKALEDARYEVGGPLKGISTSNKQHPTSNAKQLEVGR